MLATINDDCITYSNELEELIKNQGIRCKVDSRNEKLNYKIRELSLEKVPFIVVIGDKERSKKTVSLRTHGDNKLVTMKLTIFLKK